MNSLRLFGASALLFTVLASSHAQADSPVDGVVRFRAADWIAVDAVAYREGDRIDLVFSDRLFDREEIAADGVINGFDMLRHPGDTLTVHIGADGVTSCFDFLTRSGDTMESGSSCRSDFDDAVFIEVEQVERVSGSVVWDGGDEGMIDLRFDVAISAGHEGGVMSEGEPLPADGGEPGRAVSRHFELLEAGDFERLKANSHPEAREMMEESERAGEHEALLEMLRAFAPRNVRINGGMVIGDQAVVEFDGESDGAEVVGSASVRYFEGQWYFESSDTEVVGSTGVFVPEAGGGYSALMMAILFDQIEAVDVLLSEQPDLSERAPDGRTIAAMAIESGRAEIVAALLEAGADFSTPDEQGATPTMHAVRRLIWSGSGVEIVGLLGRHGADLDQHDGEYTPLFFALLMGDGDLVSALLDAGADPTLALDGRRLPITAALSNDDVLSKLLDAGADPNSLDEAGEPVIFMALRNESPSILEILLKAGADANVRDGLERSALEFARERYLDAQIDLLLSYGAVESIPDDHVQHQPAMVLPSTEGAPSVMELPRYPGSAVLFEQDAIAVYVTADEVTRVAETTMALIESVGWQGRLTAQTNTMRHLTFDLGAHELTVQVSVAPAQGNQTMIQYSVLTR